MRHISLVLPIFLIRICTMRYLIDLYNTKSGGYPLSMNDRIIPNNF